MNFLPGFVRRLARESVTQPLSDPVASNASAYLEAVGERRLGWRAFRRELVYRLSGQERFRIERLREGSRRGLWMYFGVPQVGDALMDLAPRSLFAEAGLSVDLATHPHLTELFQADPWFSKIFAAPSEISGADYDFVIVPSHKHRSLSMKQRCLPHHPWFSMHGRFTGPEFHRAEFAARRLADFLQLTLKPESFARHARQKLGREDTPGGAAESMPFSGDAVALAVGGVREERTYSHWADVVRELANAGVDTFVLLGDERAKAAADEILERADAAARIHDFVGRTSLRECHRLISRCALTLAADGGLMHLAVAAECPVVGLFQSGILPQWRLPPSDAKRAIHSNTSNVSDIAPESIARAAREALLARDRQG